MSPMPLGVVAGSIGSGLVGFVPFAATGGTVYQANGYYHHVFNSNGTFTVTSAGAGDVQPLVMLSSGGTGGSRAATSYGGNGGSGGRGGQTQLAEPIGTESITVTVGAGGAGGTSGAGSYGNESRVVIGDSTFGCQGSGAITYSTGSRWSFIGNQQGANPGYYPSSRNGSNGAAYTSTATWLSNFGTYLGGGGGAGQTADAIAGTAYSAGTGGLNGGANGGPYNANGYAATSNTGGGGGGGGWYRYYYYPPPYYYPTPVIARRNGGNGGSGFVIISYPESAVTG